MVAVANAQPGMVGRAVTLDPGNEPYGAAFVPNAQIDQEVFDTHLIHNLVTAAAQRIGNEDFEVAVGLAPGRIVIMSAAMRIGQVAFERDDALG